MKIGFLLRLFACLIAFYFYLYSFVHKQNELTRLRIEVPPLAKAHKVLVQQNAKLEFEIDQFENPAHLIELLEQAQYSHLKHPKTDDILILPSYP